MKRTCLYPHRTFCFAISSYTRLILAWVPVRSKAEILEVWRMRFGVRLNAGRVLTEFAPFKNVAGFSVQFAEGFSAKESVTHATNLDIGILFSGPAEG